MSLAKVEVAVTMIACGERILTIHNPKWGAFTFPMTKRRKWSDPEMPLGAGDEAWRAAATRVAAEVLGRTLAQEEEPQLLHDTVELRQNDEEGIWKVYNLQIYKMRLLEIPHSYGFGVVVEWLTARQLQERVPISQTVRNVIKHLEGVDLLPPWA